MSEDDLEDHVRGTIRNPVDTATRGDGSKAYLGSDGTVVIYNPGDPDGGTVFRPDDPAGYWEEHWA